jgi:hypothetical protein
MDFEISIHHSRDKQLEYVEEHAFEQFKDALKFIEHHMSQWNGFKNEHTLNITVKKVTGRTETLGVNVDDEMRLGDIFG